MTEVPDIARAAWRREPGVGRAYVIAAAMTAGEGFALVVGSPSRTSGASWATVNETGGPRVFGAAMLFVAVLMAATALRSRTLMRLALLVNATAHLILGFSFAASAYQDERASWIGSIVFCAVALWMVSQRATYIEVPQPQARPDENEQGPS